ncbi:MAG: hypothetical protein HYW01_07000 [Deltaproteobacteria bacterium]|nr:hypothetical protein [Deltaproteobacteria bacterium]
MRSKIVISLVITWIIAIAGSQAAAPGEVTGKFLGNGQSAKLAHSWAEPTEKWQGEESYVLVLSEKPATESKQPDFDAFFGELGSALTVKLTKSGDIFGTEVYHESLEKKPFSSLGTLKLENYKLEGDVISGRLTTDGPDEFSGETWEVDLTFKAKLSK